MKTIIIGGGIAGLCVAYHLSKKTGIDVTLFESETIGQATSNKAAGMITPASEVHLGDDQLMAAFAAARDLYDDFVGEITGNKPESLDYHKNGSLLCALDSDGKNELERLTRFQVSMGFEIETLTPARLREIEPALTHRIVGAALAHNEAHIETISLLEQLRHYLIHHKVDLREKTAIKNIMSSNDHVTGVELLDGTTFEADVVILASGLAKAPACDLLTPLPLRPVKGQALSLQGPPGLLSRPVRVSHRYPVYLVPRASGEIVVGATSEDLNDDNVTAGGVMDLLTAVWRVLPQAYDFPIKKTWAGLRPATPDNRPILGRASGCKNLYLMLGLYRHGILASPYLAEQLTKLILNEATNLSWPNFSQDRFTVLTAA